MVFDHDSIVDKFKDNWVFNLYGRGHKSYLKLTILVPTLIFLTGAFLPFLSGELAVFSNSLLSIASPGWIFSGFVAYYWFAAVFPKTLELVIPAMEIDTQQIGSILEKHASGIAIKRGYILFASCVVAVPNLAVMYMLWTSMEPSVATPWIDSPIRGWYFIYHSINYLILVPFFAGSGLVGIIGTILVFNDIFQYRLKLNYYRRLTFISNLSWGIAISTIIVVISSVGTLTVLPDEAFPLSAITIVTSCLALTTILFFPPFLSRQLIIRAKIESIRFVEVELHRIHQIIVDLKPTNETDTVKPYIEYQSLLQQYAKSIESVPAWSLSLSATALRFATIISPSLPLIVQSLIGY